MDYLDPMDPEYAGKDAKRTLAKEQLEARRSEAACSPSSDMPADDDLLAIAWMHGAAARKEQCRKLATERDQLRMELTAAKCTLAKWIEWARMHGHLDHAAGIAAETREILSENS